MCFFIHEALPRVMENRGIMPVISGGGGGGGAGEHKSKNKGIRGTNAILGSREHRKLRFWFWGTRENAEIFHRNDRRGTPPPTGEHKSKHKGNRRTNVIMGSREHRKLRFWFWGTRENAEIFHRNERRGTLPPGRASLLDKNLLACRLYLCCSNYRWLSLSQTLIPQKTS